MLAIIGVIALIASCAKDGEQGPAGANGTDHTAVSAADKTAFDGANGFTGGLLYDHLMNQLLINDTALTKHANFYRCKSCHGWDLLGRNGVLAQQAITSSYPEVAVNNLYAWSHMHNVREVFDAVKNTGGNYVGYLRVAAGSSTNSSAAAMPDYGQILTDAQIWDIVKFLKKDAMDVSHFYDFAVVKPYPQPTKDESAVEFYNIGKLGDPVRGANLITTKCGGCHGNDGSDINIYCQGDWLGNTFRDDPFEVQHKVKFGMPVDRDHLTTSCAGQNNSAMPAITNITEQDIRDILTAGQDTVAYPSYH